MIRYYCNKCNKEVAKDRYTVAVKLPNSEQKPAIHLCKECYKRLEKYYNLMSDGEALDEAISIGKNKAPVKDSVDSNENPIKDIGTSNENSDVNSGTSSEQLDGKSDDDIVAQALANVFTNNNDASEEDNKDPEAEKSKGKSKVYEPLSNNPASFRLHKALPVPPRKDVDLRKIRRILLNYYRGVSIKTIQDQLSIRYQGIYSCVTRYGSTIIEQRYHEYKRFCMPDSEKAVNVDTILSLYAAGFVKADVAKEVQCSEELVEQVLKWYTGV